MKQDDLAEEPVEAFAKAASGIERGRVSLAMGFGMRGDRVEKPIEAFAKATSGVGSERVSSAMELECSAISKMRGDTLIGRETGRGPAVGAGVIRAIRAETGSLAAGPFDGRRVHASRSGAGSESHFLSEPLETARSSLACADPYRRCRFGSRMAVGERGDAHGSASARPIPSGESEPAPS